MHRLPKFAITLMVLWWNERQFVFPIRMMTMLIRAATLDDAPAMSDLIRPLASAHITPDFSPAGAANLLASMAPEALVRYFHAGYVYHVAEVDGNIVGVVGVRDNRHLFHLFVSDDFHGRGFARELWRVARAACRQNGHAGDFTVNSSQFAVGMYRKFGFVEASPPVTVNDVTFIPMKLTETA